VLDDFGGDNGRIGIWVTAVVHQHRDPDSLFFITAHEISTTGLKERTKSFADVKTPPAPAQVLSSPGRWKYGTVGIRVPFSSLMISCMSHLKPSVRDFLEPLLQPRRKWKRTC
jgi:hypothetical protein